MSLLPGDEATLRLDAPEGVVAKGDRPGRLLNPRQSTCLAPALGAGARRVVMVAALSPLAAALRQ